MFFWPDRFWIFVHHQCKFVLSNKRSLASCTFLYIFVLKMTRVEIKKTMYIRLNKRLYKRHNCYHFSNIYCINSWCFKAMCWRRLSFLLALNGQKMQQKEGCLLHSNFKCLVSFPLDLYTFKQIWHWNRSHMRTLFAAVPSETAWILINIITRFSLQTVC